MRAGVCLVIKVRQTCHISTVMTDSNTNPTSKSISVYTVFPRIVKGFPEGEGGHSEFLFSLPRFAESEVS